MQNLKGSDDGRSERDVEALEFSDYDDLFAGSR